ncbi:winged helix-turn-helix domain-containing protein [Pseudobutyrivibrio xylanivorans]|uniref:winged helix-turn-helix domain-containing protein n=1 Tax=Pseudobutyrivibrio xylanivorans TaxID=185007 RepID=UPI00142EFBFC|nr:winged helix-turn-helix domain-containing protein [Pseudobutyrivibrio xylanivorans]
MSRDVRDFVGDATKGFKTSPSTSVGYDIGTEIRESIETGLKGVLGGKKERRTPFFSTKINKSKGIGKLVAGSVISFDAGIALLSNLLMIPIAASDIGIAVGVMAFESLMLISGIGLIIAGKNNRKVIKHYFEYGRIVGERPYITIRELAERTGYNPKEVLRMVKQMRKRGYLPYSALDMEETTLMLTDEVYSQYSRTEQYNSQLNEEAKNNSKEETPNNQAGKVKYYTIDEDLPQEVQNILEEGNEYLNKIRYYNDLIPDTETMSDKLYTLEATVLSIFKKVKEEPEVAGDLRKFMSYYLPTTEKLLQSYVDLRKENLSVENITNSQREIEDATDVINDAFVQLLNQLFQDAAWDISSDISVMKTMMKQDSLI